MHAISTVPPPPAAVAAKPFSLAEYRAHNDRLEASLRSPEAALRKARAQIDAALAMIAARDARRVGR